MNSIPLDDDDLPDIGDDFDEKEIARLGMLKPLEYEKVRTEAAAKLGIRTSILDKLVKKEGKADSGGTAVLFPEIEPWPQPVDGAELLTVIAAAFERHLVLPDGAADAMALWVLHAHAHDLARVSPLLALTSPTPECGKTTTLTLIGTFVPKPLPASNITAAALFRAVEKWRPTLLVDEADTFLRDSDELRGVIDSGHNRAYAYVIRTVGDDHEPACFNTWAPKAIALIGKLPVTLASRSIHIELRRMAPGESRVPVREDKIKIDPLARQCVRWVKDNEKALRHADPDMPAKLTGRRADNWRPLVAIADAAGGKWGEIARKAAEKLTVAGAGDTAGILLLQDIKGVFDTKEIDRITSADLAAELGDMQHRPWPEWRHGKPITVRQIARLLEPFKVSPSSIRTAAGTPKGYHLHQFEQAFRSYLPQFDPQHRHNPQETAENGQFRSATQALHVADENPPNLLENMNCCGVADEKPQDGREWRRPWVSDDPLDEI